MVNINKVEKLIEQIRLADAVELTGDTPNAEIGWDCEVRGEPENQVIYFSWHEGDEYLFSTILTEQGLSDATIEGNSIHCEDYEGNETHIRLWGRAPLNIVL